MSRAKFEHASVRYRARPLRTLSIALIAALSLLVMPRTASALPPPPPNPSQDQLTGAAAEKAATQQAVSSVSSEIQQNEQKLGALEVQTVNAGEDHDRAVGQLAAATKAQQQTAAAVDAAAVEVDQAETASKDLGRQSYIQGNYAYTDIMLLTSKGPDDFIDRAQMLSVAAKIQQDKIGQVQVAKAKKANADAAAKKAVLDTAAAEKLAADTLKISQDTLASAKVAFTQLQDKKSQLDSQLQVAQTSLLNLEGQKVQYDTWLAQKKAEEAAAAAAAQQKAAQQAAAAQAAAAQLAANSAASAAPDGGSSSTGDSPSGGNSPSPSSAGGSAKVSGAYALPASGTLTSCYCERWGEMHWGIDIAAPFMTPIYAAASGTVMRAGPASGFGQAIYIQHADGWVTVYGHVEAMYVVAGQEVSAGTKIAGMGSRGFSTGVHLHFEVTQGMYGARTSPIPWLAARGIYL
ncbi:MAG: M23 family metallopeptidase [Antricoccus sp.]